MSSKTLESHQAATTELSSQCWTLPRLKTLGISMSVSVAALAKKLESKTTERIMVREDWEKERMFVLVWFVVDIMDCEQDCNQRTSKKGR